MITNNHRRSQFGRTLWQGAMRMARPLEFAAAIVIEPMGGESLQTNWNFGAGSCYVFISPDCAQGAMLWQC
jgi:hypothetical protein